jgi:hypothetical protein
MPVNPPRVKRAPKRVGDEPERRLSSLIRKSLKEALEHSATLRRCTERAIVEAALEAFFDPQAQDNRDAMIARRLSRVDARLKAIEQNLAILTEWVVEDATIRLGFLPQLTTDEDRRQYNALAKSRRELIVRRVVENLQSGRTLHTELPSEFVMRTADPATQQEGTNGHETAPEN